MSPALPCRTHRLPHLPSFCKSSACDYCSCDSHPARVPHSASSCPKTKVVAGLPRAQSLELSARVLGCPYHVSDSPCSPSYCDRREASVSSQSGAKNSNSQRARSGLSLICCTCCLCSSKTLLTDADFFFLLASTAKHHDHQQPPHSPCMKPPSVRTIEYWPAAWTLSRSAGSPLSIVLPLLFVAPATICFASPSASDKPCDPRKTPPHRRSLCHSGFFSG